MVAIQHHDRNASNPAESLSDNTPLNELRTTGGYYHYKDLQRAIIDLKFRGHTELAESLGQRLAAEYGRSAWQATMITAVPLSAARLVKRGYNQAALLAQVLSRLIGLPFYGESLRRVRDTRPQSNLRAVQRVANVAGAFVAEPEIVCGQHIVLVDDVATTGATLRECAAALRNAGASAVYGLTVAAVSPDELSAAPVRNASIRILTHKTGDRYAQLVQAEGKTRSLGAFDPTSPTPILDHMLKIIGRRHSALTIEELVALRDARKDWRDLTITQHDLVRWPGAGIS